MSRIAISALTACGRKGPRATALSTMLAERARTHERIGFRGRLRSIQRIPTGEPHGCNGFLRARPSRARPRRSPRSRRSPTASGRLVRRAATDRARRSLPLGVPSSFQAYDPHPIVAKRAQAAWLEDVDGNHYVDFNMGFGALFAGHCHPKVRAAIEAQLDEGTLFVTPCESNAEVAELLAERYRLPMWRFTNSGTEATMDAIRVARGVTGRDKLVKVEGGYHGHHDEVMISMKPPISEAGPPDAPRAIPATAGITRAVLGDTIVIPYNNVEALERVLKTRRGRLLHRGAGHGEHRDLPAPARVPGGGAGADPSLRHAPHLRRGQDRHHRRLERRDGCARRAAGSGVPGQVDRGRPAHRGLRRTAGVHGLGVARARSSTSARTTATRS